LSRPFKLRKHDALGLRTVAVAALVAVCWSTAHGQSVNKWVCNFSTAATYAGGEETARDPSKFRVQRQAFTLTFVEDTKSYVVGNAGAAEVGRVQTDKGGVQFIERTGSGALQLTAFDAFGNAAHSRSTVGFDGVLMAAQHYGKCSKNALE
jgi:hypothetical protein